MAKLSKKFTRAGQETMNDFSAIPAGEYIAQIYKSDYKQTKDQQGHFLSLQFKILEGDQKDRILFVNLNLDNKNEKTVEIANKELATIIDACGFPNTCDLEDSEELHNIPMQITVAVEPKSANNPAQNRIKMYKPAEGYAKPSLASNSGEASGESSVNQSQSSGEAEVKPIKKKTKISFD